MTATRLDWWWSPHPSWEPGEDWEENVPVVGYGASVWGPPKAWWPPTRPNPSTTTELPDGIEAMT